MKVTRLAGWGLLAVILLWLPSAPHAWMSPKAPKVAYVKAYRVHNQQLDPIPVTRITHHELERVLNGIEQMAGLSSYQLPSRYLLFRFPSPVVLPRSPIGYPIKEVIVTQPSSTWDAPRLLVRNTQRQWVEYRTSRPLTHLIHQLQSSLHGYRVSLPFLAPQRLTLQCRLAEKDHPLFSPPREELQTKNRKPRMLTSILSLMEAGFCLCKGTGHP